MAMTLTQLERYMISEIENLHLKFDSVLEILSGQMKDILDRLDRNYYQHEARILTLENSVMPAKPKDEGLISS